MHSLIPDFFVQRFSVDLRPCLEHMFYKRNGMWNILNHLIPDSEKRRISIEKSRCGICFIKDNLITTSCMGYIVPKRTLESMKEYRRSVFLLPPKPLDMHFMFFDHFPFSKHLSHFESCSIPYFLHETIKFFPKPYSYRRQLFSSKLDS